LARKILLADDSVTAQNMGRRILSDAGYDVITVNNGSAALKKIAESKPDLIVLDVYMPGYGGLEVCQRLREAPETARIPVLLTVGKLEPFKADEARRVRADGFIVKPFEASELLTALTKLEDKIVPQAQPPKPSRFAKAMAGAEEFASGKEFGDKETGWKNRLSIPAPHSKPHESVPETNARDAARTEPPKPAEMNPGLEETLPPVLPLDVTAEEVAAIEAAAAAFKLLSDQLNSEPPPAPDQEATTQESAAQQLRADVVGKSISEVAQTESSAEENAAPREPAYGVPAEAESNVGPPSQIAEPAKSEDDDEVTAALAYLAPTHDPENSAGPGGQAASGDQVPATMAVASAAQEFSGPRWIAEAVALSEDEASLVLGHEMEKACAAFAAGDAVPMSFPADGPYASLSDAEARATDSGTSTPVESFSSSEPAESPVEEFTAVAPATGGEESGVPQAEANIGVSSPTEDAVSENAVSEVKEGAAYAAAASASSSEAARSESNSPVAEPSARQVESELAAAWANWKEIRDSVVGSQIVGSQISSQIADAVAETQPGVERAASPATGEETSEIANIVDSVLADLKPKLMAEIARKMGKEKNK
jgi:CheY-like chemotaxis protein